jgi:dimethylhistidine N-methyltransferase
LREEYSMTRRSSASAQVTDRAARAAAAQFAADVQYYLMQDPRQLPSQYLYDALGSALFEAICELPWYRITRAEQRLLAAHGAEVLRRVAPASTIVELGSGSGAKLWTIADRRDPDAPPLDVHLVDVSASALGASARTLASLEGVRVTTHEARYEDGLRQVTGSLGPSQRILVLFLGSNIGNFDPPGANAFLRAVRGQIRAGDWLLLGADLVKPERELLLAYDDPLGVTAAFNRNLLVRINRELGGNFDLDQFVHCIEWNATESRIEMHLVARSTQQVRVAKADTAFTLHAGDRIWTESSYKYRPEQIMVLLEAAGFRRVNQWLDTSDGFALTLVEAA